MPVKLLTSPVLRWPDRAKVDRAVRAWIAVEARRHPALMRLGYFGSYARGDWGVGSDLDLVAIVHASEERFDRRSVSWDMGTLPVPTDLIVYTLDEWDALQAGGGRLAGILLRETVWVFEKGAGER